MQGRRIRDSVGTLKILLAVVRHRSIRTFTSIPSLWTLKNTLSGAPIGCFVFSQLFIAAAQQKKKGPRGKKKAIQQSTINNNNNKNHSTSLSHSTRYHISRHQLGIQQKSRKIHKRSRASRGCSLVFSLQLSLLLYP